MPRAEERRWLVVYTKPLNEKKVHERLVQRGVEAYLPLKEEMRQWSDRKKKVQTPLIPSVVFAKMIPSEATHLYEVNGVKNVLRHLGKPAVVQDWEILNLKLLLQEQVWEEVEGETLTLGDWVVVETGPFQGAAGRVVRLQNESRVCLTLEHVGKAYVVSVPQHSLRLK